MKYTCEGTVKANTLEDIENGEELFKRKLAMNIIRDIEFNELEKVFSFIKKESFQTGDIILSAVINIRDK